MPILAAEPDRYPAHLFDGPPVGRTLARPAHQAPTRKEPGPHTCTPPASVSTCRPCPVDHAPRPGADRSRPTFPGYLFLYADHDERVTALASNRVVHSCRSTTNGGSWDDLRQVDRLLGAGLPVATETQLRAGDAGRDHDRPAGRALRDGDPHRVRPGGSWFASISFTRGHPCSWKIVPCSRSRGARVD